MSKVQRAQFVDLIVNLRGLLARNIVNTCIFHNKNTTIETKLTAGKYALTTYRPKNKLYKPYRQGYYAGQTEIVEKQKRCLP